MGGVGGREGGTEHKVRQREGEDKGTQYGAVDVMQVCLPYLHPFSLWHANVRKTQARSGQAAARRSCLGLRSGCGP